MARTDATGRAPGSRGMVAVALAAITAACGGSTTGGIPEEAFPVVANADLAVGSQRLLVGLVTVDGDWLPASDLPVAFDLYAPEAVGPSFTVDGVFLWTVPEVRGLYRADLTFESSGRWRIAAHSAGGPSTTVIPFDVAEEERAPTMGDRAPVVRTATVGEVADLSEITTDPEPDPRFYELSLDAALASGQPTVVVFATPGFCESATCGPILDNVKQVAPDFPLVNFVHVEIYENLDATTREELRVVEAVDVWRLPSEPWVFVVDATGTIAARFEGAVDPAELRAALEELS
jgi:hypothetical protein